MGGVNLGSRVRWAMDRTIGRIEGDTISETARRLLSRSTATILTSATHLSNLRLLLVRMAFSPPLRCAPLAAGELPSRRPFPQPTPHPLTPRHQEASPSTPMPLLYPNLPLVHPSSSVRRLLPRDLRLAEVDAREARQSTRTLPVEADRPEVQRQATATRARIVSPLALAHPPASPPSLPFPKIHRLPPPCTTSLAPLPLTWTNRPPPLLLPPPPPHLSSLNAASPLEPRPPTSFVKPSKRSFPPPSLPARTATIPLPWEGRAQPSVSPPSWPHTGRNWRSSEASPSRTRGRRRRGLYRLRQRPRLLVGGRRLRMEGRGDGGRGRVVTGKWRKRRRGRREGAFTPVREMGRHGIPRWKSVDRSRWGFPRRLRATKPRQVGKVGSGSTREKDQARLRVSEVRPPRQTLPFALHVRTIQS
jgi:hypothetical protein